MGVARTQPRVLVVGSGGREHALVHALSRSPRQPQLLAFPGNPGILSLARPLPACDNSAAAVVAAAVREAVELVVVGPEAYLAEGIVDLCRQAGIAAFGPTRDAARIETSKSWSKDVMLSAGVPTASHETFTEAATVRRRLESHRGKIVVKADGIAAGKGVLVTDDMDEAAAFAGGWLRAESVIDGPARVIVEEALDGEEVSLFALVSGEEVVPLGVARDYKRAYDGDAGPNTGGMGAISPPRLPIDFVEEATARCVRPVAVDMACASVPFSGVIFANLMLTDAGPKVLEFNARFGDPEAQVLLPRLRSDLLDLLESVALDRLRDTAVEFGDSHTCGVTVASAGYPSASGLPQDVVLGDAPDATFLYHAGTARPNGGHLQATGGRVFTAVGLGATEVEARARAYTLAGRISFEGAWFRSDIGR